MPHAEAFVSDTITHAPPTTGAHAYYATSGTFGPDQPGFPAKGQSFVDPIFGSTITRLTNELGSSSWSDIYSKNGNYNANNTLMAHNTRAGRQFVNPATGAVVRPSVPGNDNSSFDPVDPDIWWWYAVGGTALNKYSVSTGTSTVVKDFGQPIGNNGGSIDWIDRTGRYMVLHLGSSWRMYDVKSDVLYANPIPDSYGNDPGYTGLTPDGGYIITTNNGNPNAHRSWKVDHASKSVSTQGVIFWTLCGDHGDFVSASNGKSYWVVFECDSISAVYAVDVSIPQSDTNKPKQLADNRQLMKISWSDSGHFSRVSRGPYQDWAFGSIESGDDAFGASVNNWRPFEQEILMVNVLSGEVRRLAHHRSRSPFSNYYYQPRVSASWDGGFVAWASNFGLSSNGYADIYSIRVNTDTGSGTNGGGTTPSPVTAGFTNPASGAAVSGTTTVTTSASGGSGTGYTYTVKAGTSTIYSGTNPTFSWNTTTVANGSVALAATVSDSAGATGSATRTVTVSNASTGGGTGTPTTENVFWTSPVRVAVSGNTITKNTGCDGCWDAGAVSQQTIASGDGSVQFTASNAYLSAGLSNGNPGTSANEIQFALKFSPGYVEVREGGVYKIDWAYAAGATYKVAVEGGTVKYYENGTLRYTSTIAPTYPLLVDSTIGTIGASIQNAVIATGGAQTADTTAPTVSITAPAAGMTLSGSVIVSAIAADNVAVTGVQFKVDGATLGAEVTTAPYAATWNASGATAGTHVLVAIARDAAGNTTTSAPVTVVVRDLTAPTVTVTAPSSGATVSGTVTLGATASDNVAVVGVQFKVDGVNAGPEATTAPYAATWNASGAAAGTHTVVAVARDAAGNTTTSAPVTVTVRDTTAPTVSVTAPVAGTTVPPGAVTLGATASDNVAVSGVQLTVDGVNVGPEVAIAPYTATWAAAAVGTHTITAIARDAAGNTTTSAPVTITVADTTPPTVSITSPVNGTLVAGVVTVSAATADDVAVTGVQFKVNGVSVGTEVYGTPCATRLDVSALGTGTHVLTAVARDAAGNTTTSAPVAVTVLDTTSPVVTVTAPGGGTTVSGTVTLSAAATDNIAVVAVQFQLDGVNVGSESTAAPFALSWNTTTIANGPHTVTALARDAAGNITTSAPVTVAVANGPLPQDIAWTSPVRVTVNGNTITKTSGCQGCWDAGAASQQVLASGEGWVAFTVSHGASATVGLSVGNASTKSTEIKFGLRFSAALVEVRERGIWKEDWPLVPGATYKIAVEAGAVKYYQDGVLKYTSRTRPVYPLLLDATLDYIGTAVQGAVMMITPR